VDSPTHGAGPRIFLIPLKARRYHPDSSGTEFFAPVTQIQILRSFLPCL
jgi:hypothetical protein